MEENRAFYVYAYYIKSTDKIFHIGKGTKNRYKDTKNHRNQYFLNILNKYKDDVAVKILQDGLTEQEAWDLERELIEKYKTLGQCETNLHEGGCGGYTGNYDSEERSRKISEFAKTRTGEKNPNYGNKWSEEQKEQASKKHKEWWAQHPEAKEKISKLHRGKTPWNKGLTKETDSRIKESSNKGKKMTEEQYNKMMDRDCPFLYKVFLHDELIFENISSKKLEEFCSQELGISRTIIEKVIKKEWKPTFKKHQHLQTLQILKIDRKCID